MRMAGRCQGTVIYCLRPCVRSAEQSRTLVDGFGRNQRKYIFGGIIVLHAYRRRQEEAKACMCLDIHLSWCTWQMNHRYDGIVCAGSMYFPTVCTRPALCILLLCASIFGCNRHIVAEVGQRNDAPLRGPPQWVAVVTCGELAQCAQPLFLWMKRPKGVEICYLGADWAGNCGARPRCHVVDTAVQTGGFLVQSGGFFGIHPTPPRPPPRPTSLVQRTLAFGPYFFRT